MKIVITGSSGSLAQGLIEVTLSSTDYTLLLVDHVPPSEERVIKDPRVEYETADLREYATFARVVKGADALVHLAAYPQPYLSTPDVIHNTNVTLSFNALQAAVDAGIRHVVLASSVNAIGGAYSKVHKYEYFPVDEDHPSFVDEPYSLSKQIVEIQAASFSRAHPEMSISCFRFHHVVPTKKVMRGDESVKHNAKDLWGWTNPHAAGRACLLALEVEWTGSEVMYAVGEEHCVPEWEAEMLAQTYYPDAKLNRQMAPYEGFFDCSKAERLLGWKHTGGRVPQAPKPHTVSPPENKAEKTGSCVVM